MRGDKIDNKEGLDVPDGRNDELDSMTDMFPTKELGLGDEEECEDSLILEGFWTGFFETFPLDCNEDS